MAKRNSTSEALARCKDSAQRDTETQAESVCVGNALNPERIWSIIDDERMRLMKAHSILQCVAIAMEAEQVCASDGPYWPSVIESALEMINESLRRLDGPKSLLRAFASDQNKADPDR